MAIQNPQQNTQQSLLSSTPTTTETAPLIDDTQDTAVASRTAHIRTFSPLRTSRSSVQLDIDTATSETQPLVDPHADDSLLSSDFDSEEDQDPEQMSSDPSSKPKKRSKAAANGHTNGHTNGHAPVNGHSTGADSPTMLEHRRKTRPEGREAATEHLMHRSSFSLDDPVPATMGMEEADGSHGPAARGFSQLSKKDQKNFLLLVLLYFLQGLPMGLAMGSVPLLLKQHVSYSQMGVFSLAGYPYSLKLLWSPIVDAVWSPKLGRRKSWILPIQTLSGIGMLWLASMVEDLINEAGGNGGQNVWGFTMWWFSLVFMCATQDIAVDGTLQLFC
jgi:MFS transporter, PAT family, solute carrier family 33 (acetyl-CoA transportor), member 1